MISKISILEAFKKAEDQLRSCFDTVAALSVASADMDQHDIVGFQSKLISTISSIEELYRKIKSEEKSLVSRKPTLNQTWFIRRMAKLSHYTKAIRNVLAIARAIGDGFAWLFYERDREFIAEHMKHESQQFLPVGLGALGERLTVERLPVLDDKILIYHGTTTFLRIGDVSLISLKSMRLACIGELKTTKIDDNNLQISISFISGDEESLPKPPKDQEYSKLEPSVIPDLKQSIIDRHKRQQRAMENAVSNARSKSTERIDSKKTEFYFDELEKVSALSHPRCFEFIQAGKGMLLGAVRHKKIQSFSERFLSEKEANIDDIFGDLSSHVQQICAKNTEGNSIILGGIGADYSDLTFDEDKIPFVLWPMSTAVIREIIFGQVFIVTILNPVHIWQAIRERGFTVSLTENGKFIEAKKKIDSKEMTLGNMSHFLHNIQHNLLTEASVISLIDQMIDVLMVKVADTKTDHVLKVVPRMFRSRPATN